MRPEDILRLLQVRPFQPFRISLSDGHEYDVRHPELAMVGRATVHIGLPDPEGPQGTFESWVACALIHITKLEPVDRTAAS